MCARKAHPCTFFLNPHKALTRPLEHGHPFTPKLPALSLGGAGDEEVVHRRPLRPAKHPSHATNGSGDNRTVPPPMVVDFDNLFFGERFLGLHYFFACPCNDIEEYTMKERIQRNARIYFQIFTSKNFGKKL